LVSEMIFVQKDRTILDVLNLASREMGEYDVAALIRDGHEVCAINFATGEGAPASIRGAPGDRPGPSGKTKAIAITWRPRASGETKFYE